MKTQKERMLSGELYQVNDDLRKEARECRKLLRKFNQTTVEELEKRYEIIKELFNQTKEHFYIEPPFFSDYGGNISIGDNFYANTDCVFLDVAPITIGNNVMFGPRVGLYTPGHPIDALVRISGPEFGTAITIGDNVWIGGNAIVNPGVTIGNNTIIGSGSVVTKDIPDNVIAAGNPCRVIRPITDADTKYWQEKHQQFLSEIK